MGDDTADVVRSARVVDEPQQAVDRLGGTMNIENDAGAIFTVTVPVTAPSSEPEQEQ